MTAAPHASPTRRILVTAAFSAAFLVLGVLALTEYGLGPAIFLFVLATVGVVDLVQVVLRERRRRG